MIRRETLPIKVIDDFFEIPSLWRHFALKQEYSRDSRYSTWPGVRTDTLDRLDVNLFHSLAGKIMYHLPQFKYFKNLQVNFSLVDETHGRGWIHDDEPKWNVAGIIYLSPNPPANSGTLFYRKIATSNQDFNKIFFEEVCSKPEDRPGYEKYKTEQRALYEKTMTVGNLYNRCLIFNPDMWHSADTYFGKTKDDSRLTINFFGYAE